MGNPLSDFGMSDKGFETFIEKMVWFTKNVLPLAFIYISLKVDFYSTGGWWVFDQNGKMYRRKK